MAMVVKEEATEINSRGLPWAAAGTNANANETQTNPRAARIHILVTMHRHQLQSIPTLSSCCRMRMRNECLGMNFNFIRL